MASNGEFTRFDPYSKENKSSENKKGFGSDSDGKRFKCPINIYLNYWEIKPSQYENKLQELLLKGVTVVSTFVPWSHVETDIHHSLRKFLKAAWLVKVKVRLFVMPELGMNYPNASVPKDLLNNTANLAISSIGLGTGHGGTVIYNHAAPNVFPLPSFSSPEVLKRFGNFLIKVGGIVSETFSEIGKTIEPFCEIVVTNSFFNYYRSQNMKLSEHGDYSAAHVISFKEFLDKEYLNKDVGKSNEFAPSRFTDSNFGSGSNAEHADQQTYIRGADSEQFKMQMYDRYNRHRYFTHVEQALRDKTDLVFSRKSAMCHIEHMDLLSPECAPEARYQALLTEVLDFKPSVQTYYESIVQAGYRGESIFLPSSGIFRRFNDQEKSFLILAALIYSESVCFMAEDYLKLSPGFQRKLKSLKQILESGLYYKSKQVSYMSASKFSMDEASFSIFRRLAGAQLSVETSLLMQKRPTSERLVFMDPHSVIRLYELINLLTAAQKGKVVAIPLPMKLIANYTSEAASYLEKIRKHKNPIRMNLGLQYEVYNYHLGQVVLYDPESFWTTSLDMTEAHVRENQTRFIQSLLGLAGVEKTCTVSETTGQISVYTMHENSSRQLLFLINPTNKQLNLNIHFDKSVEITNLILGNPMLTLGASSRKEDAAQQPIQGNTFELPVPALGVFCLNLNHDVVLSESSQELHSEEILQDYFEKNTVVPKDL